MKESIGQAFIVNLILVFFGVLILLLFGSFNYTKAFKVKNRVINIIEKHGGYPKEEEEKKAYEIVRDEIYDNMREAGYSTTNIKGSTDKCDKLKETGTRIYPNANVKNQQRYYDYCVFQYDSGIGEYYKVVVYMKFEVPLIGGLLEFPVRGETRVLYDNIDG